MTLTLPCTLHFNKKLRFEQVSLDVQWVKSRPAVQENHLDPSLGKIPWSRKWQLTPVFLLGEVHGQRILVGYCLWVTKSQTRLSD